MANPLNAIPGENYAQYEARVAPIQAANGPSGVAPTPVATPTPASIAQPQIQQPAPVTQTQPTPYTPSTMSQTYQFNPNAINDASRASANFAGTGLDQSSQDSIRADTLRSFQTEINAQNDLYATKLQNAQIQGANRLGSNTAINARRGLAGSDFGNATTNTINTGNNQVYDGIAAEKAASISAILNKSDGAAKQAIAEKTASKQAGLDAYLKYLTAGADRTDKNAQVAAGQVVSGGHALSDLTPDQINQLTSNYGITSDQLKAAYGPLQDAKVQSDQKVKNTQDGLDAKIALEQQKANESVANIERYASQTKRNSFLPISNGSQLYDINSNKVVANNPKVFAPKSARVPSGGGYKNFTSKPNTTAISAVNQYITAHNGNQAAISQANSNEEQFYKILNAANAAKDKGKSVL